MVFFLNFFQNENICQFENPNMSINVHEGRIDGI